MDGMNNYVTFDNYKYKTPATEWKPASSKPSMVRQTLSGALDVTYGPGGFYEWDGNIEGPVTADTGWGTIANLRTSLAKRTAITFIDHYGASYTAHAIGPFSEESKTPMWDGAGNRISVRVKIVRGV
jgi:hypothetical protein